MFHEKRKDFICPICNEGFSHNYRLKYHHQIKHSDERNFQCDFEGCAEKFKTSRDLLQHKRAHTPYTCSICDKVFSRRERFKDHITGKPPTRAVAVSTLITH